MVLHNKSFHHVCHCPVAFDWQLDERRDILLLAVNSFLLGEQSGLHLRSGKDF